jgi:hypothetical protein
VAGKPDRESSFAGRSIESWERDGSIDPGRSHHGIVLVSGASFPLSASAIGQLVGALDRLMAAHEEDEALVGQVMWLSRA